MPNRSLLIALATIAVLSLTAAPAAAKGVQSATVCGTNDCVQLDRGEADEQLIFGSGYSPGPPSKSEAGAEGFYRMQVQIGAGGHVEETLNLKVLPGSGHIYSPDRLGGSIWSEMTTEQQALYARVTTGLEPFSGAKLTGLSNPKLPAANDAPPAAPADSGAGDDSTFPWLIVLGALAALAAAWMVWRVRRRTVPPATV